MRIDKNVVDRIKRVLFKAKKPKINGVWTKASELKAGQMIAVAGKDGKLAFEKVVSIERLDRPERVYDIQVANTHTFVGNDIIAHNTYIAKKTGKPKKPSSKA